LYDAINANINISIFSSQHLGSTPSTPEVPSKMPRELSWKTLPGEDTRITGQSI